MARPHRDLERGRRGWPRWAIGILTLGGLGLIALPSPAQANICSRTPQVALAILENLSSNNGDNDDLICSEVTAEDLNRVTELDLVSEGLSTLKDNDFANLSSLQYLYLRSNSLSSLDATIFDDLSDLRRLHLEGNALSSLDANIFNDLANVRRLYLDFNVLGSLDANIFDGLANVRRLGLDNNSLGSLDADIFDGLSNLRELALRNNNLSSLDTNIFNDLSNLQDFYLAGNRLACLPRGTLWERVADGDLSLDVDLPDCFGVSLNVTPRSVEEDNGGEDVTVTAALRDGPRQTSAATEVTIAVVGDTATKGVDFVAVNDFTITIPEGSGSATGTFTLTATVDAVVEADDETVLVSGTSSLSSSPMPGTEVSGATITIRDVLATSICDRTPAVRDAIIRRIPEVSSLEDCAEITLAQMSAITGSLNVGGQGLVSLQEHDFADLSNLGELYLDQNNLSNLPEDIFTDLSSIRWINLRDNKLSSLDMDVFAGLSNIQYLILYNNNLRSLPGGIFRDLSSLKSLLLSGNSLVCLPRSVPWERVDIRELSIDVNLPDCFGVSLSVTPMELEESNERETITVSATLSAGPRVKSGQETRVTISVEEGTAREGADFTAVDDFTITIPYGSGSATGTFTLMEIRDTEVEPGGDTVRVSGRSRLSSSAVPGTEVSDTTVTIYDASPGVKLEPAAVRVIEGSSGIYTLVLNALPSGYITITPSSGDSGALAMSPASLTFTTTNWDRPQTIMVTGVEDDDATAEIVTISHSVSGYGDVTVGDVVTVSVTDDEALPQVSVCDRTPAVRDAIIEQVESTTDCREITASHLSAITGELDLTAKRLNNLKETDFAGLSSLTRLLLFDNDLSSLPEEVFAGLSSLEWLYLYHNPLSSLPEDLFAGLTSLTDLYLAPGTGVTCVPLSSVLWERVDQSSLIIGSLDLPDCFGVSLSISPAEANEDNGGGEHTVTAILSNGPRGRRVDTQVSISLSAGTAQNTDFRAVEPFTITIPNGSESATGTFTLTATEDMEKEEDETVVVSGRSTISFGQRDHGDHGDYSAEVSSTTVTIKNVVPMPAPICDRTPIVQTVILEAIDGITSCEDVTVYHLNRIRALFLGWNPDELGGLQEGDFGHLASLRQLWLYHNDLSSLPANIFAGLASLNELYLNNNSLNSLDASIFGDLYSLEFLYLDNNQLRSLPEDIFNGLSNLQGLLLDDNDLTCLPRSMALWERVAEGDLSLDVPDCFGVSLSLAPVEVGEDNGGETITVTATLSNGPRPKPGEVTQVTISVEGDTAIEDRDFVAVEPFTITIPDRSDSATGTFTLMAVADTEEESGGETVLVNGTSSLSASSVPGTEVSGATVTIKNATEASICDRTPEVQSAILKAIPGITDCADVTINHLNRITGVLALTGVSESERLSSLKEDDFAHLSSLQYLYLDSNALSNLSANIFSDLSSVQWILLNDNSLSSLPEGVFDGLASLQELYLNNNTLSSLPEAIFDGLSQLIVLGLSGNSLPCLQRAEVWSRVTDGDLSLDVPDCFGVSLSVTPTEVMEDNRGSRVTVSATLNDGPRATPVDTQVTISVAGDTAAEGVDFTPMETITITIPHRSASAAGAFILRATEDTEAEPGGETVRVSGTSIFSSSLIPGTEVSDAMVTIKDNVLTPICDRTPAVQTAILQELDGISACEDVTLIGLNRLSGSLTLNAQGLSSLQENDFAHLSSLQWLLLNDNTLSNLPENIFADLSSLVVLDLRNNNLNSLPEGIFTNLTSLQSLRLRENNLECLPPSLPWGRVADGDLALDVNLPDCFGVSLTITPLEVREGNGGESIAVSAILRDGERAKQVDTQVSISVAGDTASEGMDFAAVEPFTITIPSGHANATATFILRATADTEVEPGGETVLVSGASNMGAYAAQVGSATVTIKDALPGVSVSPTSLTLLEGSSGVYTLVLDALPTGAVTITPTSGESGALAVSPASLIFTTTNWHTAQTVTMNAEEDDDTNDATINVSHGVSGYGGISIGDVVTVSITDDDATPTVGVCDRTPAVERAILERIDDITACADVTVGHLNSIAGTLRVNFMSSELMTLKQGDFNNLSNMENLFLFNNNQLSSLPANIFAGLSSLKQILLTNNALESLDAGIFDGLTNLEGLLLRNNRLSSLDADIFDDLTNLKILLLDGNNLNSLPEGILDGPANLKALHLTANNLMCLPRSMPWNRMATGVGDLTHDVEDLSDCFGVSLNVAPIEVDEGNGRESITVSASLNDGPRAKPDEATQVSISVMGDTATEGADFTAVEPFIITIPAGRETATGTFTLNARWDTVEDDGETVVVSGTSILSASSVSGTEVSAATVTIRNMVPPDFSLSLTANQRQVNEGENIYFTITRARLDLLSTAPLPATTIWVRIGYHNKILEPGVGLPATLRRVAFEEGQESFELLAVVTHDDELNDGDGMVRADLDLGAAASFYDVLQSKAWTRVVDDDVPEVTLVLLKERVIEGEDGYQFQIRRSCCSGQILNLSFGVEHRFFVNKDYLREDIYGPYQEIYHSNVNELHRGGSALRFEPGETMKFFRYYQPGFVGQYLSGPLGGYLRLAIITYPYDARLDEDPQEIPRYWNDTFDRRYSVSDTDYDKTLRIDNYAPGVSIETSQSSIVEGDEVEFTIKRFGGPPNLFSLIPHNIRIEVEQIGDYLPASELGTRIIRMELGQTEYKLKIPTNNDSFYDPDGSVTVTLLEGAPTNLGEDTYDLPGEYNPFRQASVNITDNDDENSYIALSPTELQIPEGDSGTYTVMLTAPPEIGYINIKPLKFPGGDPDVAVVSSTLTFSAADWNIPQTVTITAEEDGDMDDDSAEIVHTVEFLPTSESPFRTNVVVFNPSVQVSALDDDLPRVDLSLSDSSISEAGGIATVTATLSESLTTSTSLNVLVTPVAPAGSTDYQLSSNSTLTFSAGETTAKGTVTITAVNNDVDEPDKVLRVRGEITGETNILVNNELELVIQDDDSRGLTASTNTLSIHEGHTGTYTVVLDTQPTGDVTVTPSRSSGDTDMTISDALTFSVSNWNVPQTITITAPEDGDDKDGVASIVHQTSGGDYDNLGQLGIVIVNIPDNDTPGITLSKTTLAIDEGSSGTYTVVLNTQPNNGDVIVTPSRSSGDEDVTVSRALIFSSGNWNIPQTITVHATDDDDPNDDTATITHAISGANYGAVNAASVQLRVTDSDPRGVTLSKTNLAIDEGSTATYTVVLNTLPSGNVTITPSRSDGSDVDITVSDTLTFSIANWNIPQTVTVRAAEDNDPNDDAATILHAVSGADYAVVIAASVDVIVTDNDTRGVTLSEPTLSMNEGSTGTYTVVLDTQPTGDVTVTPSRNDDGDTDVTVSNVLTFSISNWNTPQAVTVHAAEDNDPNNDKATIAHAVSGADYETITAAPAVTVTVTDNDTRGVTLSKTTLNFNEGSTVTYTVVLDAQPTGEVTVTPSKSDDSDTDVTVSDALTFSSGNWDTPQTVTVNAAEDSDAVNDTATIAHTVSGADYGSVTAASVDMIVTDRDTRGITVSQISLSFNEGGTITYTVVLDTQPTGEVTITPSKSSGDTDVTVSDTLTFSAGNWNISQTVTVRAAEDDDASNDDATITHAVSGADYASVTTAPAVMVSVADNDTAGVSVEPTSLSPSEGGTLTYTMTLVTLPSGNVTITPGSSDSGAVSVEPTRLTFTPSNWDTPRTVSLTAEQDDDTTNETVTVSHSVSGYSSVTADSVTVAVTDDDNIPSQSNLNNNTRGVTLSQTALSVNEESTATYTVVLDTRPSGGVTVTPSRSDSNRDVTVSGALTFSTSNWDTAQTVTISAAEDPDANDDSSTVTHFVSGADYASVTAASIDVIVIDDDTRSVTISETILSLNEGSTITYTVMLDTQPSGDVTITPARTDDSDTDVTVSSALTFSTGNWNIPQTVTVNAAEDNDASNDAATITHTVSGADYDSVAAASVDVIVTDSDNRGITISEPTVSLNEGGTVSYTVVLHTQPTDDVTVTPSRSDDSDTDVTVSSPLTFSTGNWNIPQTVTVNAAEDNDASNDAATITHTVSGADYDSVAAASVQVTVTDSDTHGVTISETALSFNEGGTVSYTVVLNTQPTGDVTVTPSRSDDSDTDVTVSSPLTFSTGNWNIPQTVTVNAAEDSDASNDTATITHTVSGADYDSVAAASVQMTVTDNDTGGITVSETALTFNEGGTATYTVVLNTQPTGDVTVTPSRSDDSDTDVIVSSPLTFSTGNWNIPQTVTVNAAEDSDASNDTATITHAVSGADYDSVTTASVQMTVTDNDTGGITVSETALTFNEGGTVSYTVVLHTQPTGDVTVTPSRTDDSDTDVTVSSALTFSTGNWNIPQTVTVNAAEDNDASNDAATITHTVSGADYDSVAAASVDVIVTDSDNRGITISEPTVSLNEGGTVSYTVVLHTQPTDDVTVTPSRSDDSDTDVTVSSALTFSTGNWNIPQTVTVNAAEDSDASNDTATITHTVSGADYDSVAAASVQMTVTDNDTGGITVSETALTFNEGGTATYTVVLNTQPTGDVTVTPSRSDDSDTDVIVSSPLTFSTGNWNIPQTVTVNAAEDSDASNDTATITHTVSGADYDSVAAASVQMTVTDNDTGGITVSETALTFNEGGTATYTVVLNTQPTGDVTVTPSRSGDSDTDVIVSSPLTFSTGNWNIPQTVTVNAAEDSDASNDTATITHAVSGADYDSVTTASVQMTVTDNDTGGITVSETALTFNEGGTVSYTVVLHTQPTGDVTVTPSRTDDSDTDVTVSSALTFSTGNWNIPQTVTVNAAEDNDASNDAATITHTVSGADYDSVAAASVDVIVTDSDNRGITISEPTVSLNEGGTVSYTVVLHTQPTDDVTVTPSRSDDSDTDVTVSSALTFSTGNWNIPQTVTVNAAEDSDASNDTATITHTVSGADYDSVAAASVQMTVTDNDTGGITVSETALTFNEGGTATYTVVLNTQPTGDVTVTPSRSDDSDTDVIVSSALTFSTGNWNIPQTVTVNAAEDSDASNDTATITHTVSGADYDSVAAASVQMTVTDNDTGGITVSETALTFNEGGTVSYTVVLNTQPTGDVIVTPSRSGDSDTDVIVSSPLTFSTGNWNIPQTVTVNAAEDSDASNDTATITHTVSGADYDSVAAASVDVIVTDSDTRDITISETALTFNEGGTATYTVVLHTQPTDDVTVTPSRSDDSDTDVTVSNALVFSTGDWNIPQTVTINAAEDNDASNDTATITHTVSGADYDSVAAASVQMTVTDNDTGGITVSETALTFNEGGTATYTVVLNTQPTGDVTVTLSRSDDSDTDVIVSSPLTFSTGNWNIPQTVTVNAAEDNDASNDAATITHTVSGADYDTVTAASVDVIVTDSDTRDITISETALTFNEGGTVSYTVVLNTQPTGDVTVTPSRSDDSDTDVIVSNALTFSTGNWNIPQTVTVNAAEDDNPDHDTATITHTISGADYDSVTAALLQVTVTDSDTHGITISEPTLTFNEGGTATYTVVLNTQPSGDVTVTPSRTDDSDTDVTVSNALTFSTGNWNTPQTVTVRAAEDDDPDHDTATITHDVSGADYDTITSTPAVTITVTDNDTRGVTISKKILNFDEGSTEIYTVVLNACSTGDVMVTPSKSSGDMDVTVSDTLTFSPSNWDTPQTVTVSAVEERDVSNDTATITHAVSGADYGSVPAASVQIMVNDHSTAATVLTLEASPEIVQEEDGTRMVTLTGTLNKAPWTTHMHVLVTVGAAGDGAIEGVDYSQVADLTLTIPAGETVGTTTFTLTLLDDSIDEHDETILVAGSSLQMEVIPTTITIRNNDPMPQGWLSRFGRTVADQVLDAVAGRLQASRHTGIDVQLAGQQLGSSLIENDLQRLWSEKIREEDLLTNSSFTLTTGSEDTGFAGLWGQGAISHFRGREENLSLDGDVLSGMVGMDWTHGPTAAGLLLSHASGQGTFYSDVDAGTAAATLTGLYPYAHHAFNEQMALWGVLGYGQGGYTLTQQHLPPIASNISLVMAALSGRNALVQPSVEDDFTIAVKADLLAVQLSSEAVSGMFKGTEALVTRFRLGLEGSRQLQLDNGNLLTPSFEVGVRRDGGDAEIGFGADIGMGLAWSNPALGVASELRGRALLTHAAAGFHEQGLALDFSYDPTPSSQHGLSFSMGQSMGAAASGGMDALLSPTTLAALDSPADVGQQQLEARLAYGFPILGDALYMTPSLGFTRSPQDRTYGLGLTFSPSDNHPLHTTDLELSLEGERRESINADATPEHSLQLRFFFPLGGTH